MIPRPQTTTTPRLAILHPLLLVAAVLIPWPQEWATARAVMDRLRSPATSSTEKDAEGRSAGYYVELVEGHGRRSSHHGRTDRTVGFHEAEVIQYLDNDFLLFELKPEAHRTLFGRPFVTNAYGMHDYPVVPEKSEGTFRIAVLGASMDMGWGVRSEETYIHRLEERLNAVDAGKPGRPRRYEVLNFAVAAYSPLQRLEALRRKVMMFEPDLVIYSATTLDIRLMEIHLCDLIRQRVDLKYDFVREAVARCRLTDDDGRLDDQGMLVNKPTLKQKLRPSYWWLYDQTLGAIAAECRSAGVPLAMIIIPRVGPEDAPSARAEPVARLSAMAAHHAIPALNLSGTFDRDDPAALAVADGDDHPNAIGHERLFEALIQAIAADPRLSRLVPCSTLPNDGDRPHGRSSTHPTQPKSEFRELP